MFRSNYSLQIKAYANANGVEGLLQVSVLLWEHFVVSSAEVEFEVAVLGACKLLLVEELKFPSKKPTKHCCDYKATINIVNSLVQHNNSNHFEVNRYFIKEKLETVLICMFYVSVEEQLENVLTKGLHIGMFLCLIKTLGLIDIFGPTCVGVFKISKVQELVLFYFSAKIVRIICFIYLCFEKCLFLVYRKLVVEFVSSCFVASIST